MTVFPLRDRLAYFSTFPKFRVKNIHPVPNINPLTQEKLNAYMVDANRILGFNLPVGAFHYYYDDEDIEIPPFNVVKDIAFVGNPYYNIYSKNKIVLPYPAHYLHSYIYPKGEIILSDIDTSKRCYVCNSESCHPPAICYKRKLGVL